MGGIFGDTLFWISEKKSPYRALYRRYFELYANKLIKLFEWDGLPVPTSDIEWYLATDGIMGFVRKPAGGIYGMRTSPIGVTAYPDRFTKFVYSTPVLSGAAEVNKNGVLVRNNMSSTPTVYLAQMYADLSAHAYLSLRTALINTRATGVFFAEDQAQAESINTWYKGLVDGKMSAILDANGLRSLLGDGAGMRLESNQFPSTICLKDYLDTMQNLENAFYSEIGVKTAEQKRERMVTNEVTSGDAMLKFNVDDMLTERQEACEAMNVLWGINASVKLRINKFDVEQGGVDDGEEISAE